MEGGDEGILATVEVIEAGQADVGDTEVGVLYLVANLLQGGEDSAENAAV